MTDHERFRELLALRLYDELEEVEQHELASHLESCASCQRFGEELATGLGAVPRGGGDADVVLPDSWDRDLRDAIRATRPSALRTLTVFAAGLAAGLLVMALLRAPSGAETSNDRVPGAFAARENPPAHTTSSGQRSTVNWILGGR